MRWSSILLVPALLTLACAEPDEGAPPQELEPGLILDIDGAELDGSYADDEHALRFHAVTGGPGFSVRVELNGMTISAQMDGDGILEHDGWTSETGEATQMTDADRAALAKLAAVLGELGPEVEAPVARVRGFADMWSEYPSTLDLHGKVDAGFRSYTSICSLLDSYQLTTHDDGSYDNWDDETTYYAYVSMHPAGPCSDGTWFWTGSTWTCFEPDHSTSIEYAYGACFGRCGGGCGSSTQFTWDCHDHDGCVRFGHSLASLYCDDEFTSTIDDWASAPDCL